jgi:hypothetical protein
MGFRGAGRFALLAALLGHSAAFASSGGITGQSVAGCTLGGCHGDAPGSYNYTGSVQRFTGSVWTTSSTTVSRNAALSIRYYLTYNSGSVAGRGGFDMTANGGTLTEADGTLQNFSGEITHTTPRALTGNDINFNNITWTAPNSSGDFTIFACGQPVNFAGDGNVGDGPHRCDSLLITVNNPPVIGNVANQAISEDGTTGSLAFTVSDTETAAGSLTVTRSSSNTTLVPLANAVLGGSGGSRTITVTPAANQSGTSTITITVTDGNSLTDTDTFDVTVSAVNDTPTVSNVANQSINEDANTGALAVTVGDVETAAGSLTMSGSSSNTTLVPNANIVFGGSGSARTVTVTPAANQSGLATITVNASDGVATGFDTFTLTVNAVNDTPTISNVANQSIAEDANTGALAVTVGDVETAAGSLILSGSSSNTTLVPNANIVFGGSGSARTVTITPAANQNGSATITLDVSDGVASAQDALTLTVSAVNDGPVAVNDTESVSKNSTNNAFSPLANDTDVDAGDTRTITLVGTPSAGGSVSIVGAGANNTLSYTPATNYSGTETISYTMRDAAMVTSSATITVTVGTGVAPVAVDDTATVAEDSTGNAINPLANDTDADVGDTKEIVAVGTPNNGGSVSIVGSGPNNTLSYTPAANFAGTETFTYTVRDAGLLTDIGSVSVTVTGVNDAPTISDITNRTIAEDANTGAVAFTVGDVETAAGSLTVAGSSSNTTLVPNANIVFGGSGASRSVTVTPAADQNGSATITVSVSDGTASTPDTFVLTVSAGNDAPVIAVIPDQASADAQLFTYTVSVSDVDGETSFGFDLIGEPAGMSIDSGGTITWTPPIGTSGVFTPTVEATDGSSATHTRGFQLTISAPDSDGDGMPDSFEDLHGFDKNDASDAAEDADGDGVSNLDEYLGDTDPTVDDIAPSVSAPADLVVPATGYVTVVDLGAVSATDGLDGAVTATSDLSSTALRPGRYLVTWTASDAAGNVGTDTQTVDVLPLAELNVGQSVGDGATVTVAVMLNGTPPEYPVTIPYTVGGTAGPADSNAASGTFTINAGTSASVDVDVTVDGAGEPAETVVFTLTGATQAVLGTRTTHTITIVDANVAPVITVSAAQGALPRLVAYQDDGLMTFSADTFDGNGNALTFNWAASDDDLGIDGTTTAAASFDASTVAPGTYPVRVTVSDGLAQTTATLLVVVVAGSSPDADVDLDGIADSVDSVTDYGALLEDQTGDPAIAALLETEPGLSLRRGRTSMAADRTGALIDMSDLVTVGVGEGGLPLGADSYDHAGGIFDFEIHGLAPGGGASVVLPLQSGIRTGAVYRKFHPIEGWHDFVVTAGNAVASAHSTLGQCPGPASDAYVDGLQPFADCVRLTLTDGGPNDADDVADGVIRDPGGVALADGTGGGGDDDSSTVSGGAFTALPLLLLAALLRLRRRAGLAALALVALLVAAPARAEHHVRIHYGGDLASGFDDNVTNAPNAADVRESGFASAGGNVDYQRALSLYTTLLVRGSVQAEYWNSFDGLNNGKATVMARMLYRGDGDFWTPTWAAWLSAAAWEFDSEIRDSNEYRGGVFLTENLTTEVSGRIALNYTLRESEGLVFDVSGASASLNLDWRPAPRATVYTGYQFYDGDVTSTATPSLWIGLAADAIEPDDAFGGLAGGLRAYRLDAQAQVATLSFNYALSRKLSADLQAQYINTRATSRIDYERMVGVLSLLARF